MPETIHRSLSAFADGVLLSASRLELILREELSLAPALFLLKLSGLPEGEAERLSRARVLEVRTENTVLARGTVAEVLQEETEKGPVLSASFSPVLPLLDTFVSLSVPAGVPLSRTLSLILAAAGGIPLSFSRPDPALPRAQAFHGRAADAVREAVAVTDSRCCMTSTGLRVVPSSCGPSPLSLSPADLAGLPSPAGPHFCVPVRPAGWSVGDCLSVPFRGGMLKGTVIARSLHLDSASGPWRAELLMSHGSD